MDWKKLTVGWVQGSRLKVSRLHSAQQSPNNHKLNSNSKVKFNADRSTKSKGKSSPNADSTRRVLSLKDSITRNYTSQYKVCNNNFLYIKSFIIFLLLQDPWTPHPLHNASLSGLLDIEECVDLMSYLEIKSYFLLLYSIIRVPHQ